MTGGRLVLLNASIAVVACGVGGWANNYLIRQPEVNRGIAIQDPVTQEQLGISKKCADIARWQTANSRLFLASPLILPAIMMIGLERFRLVPKGKVGMEMLKFML